MSPSHVWDGPEAALPRNVTAPRYALPMTPCRDTLPVRPLPVAPENVPPEAVAFLQRQLVRHGPEVDDYEARVMIAGLIAVLAPVTDSRRTGLTPEAGPERRRQTPRETELPGD